MKKIFFALLIVFSGLFSVIPVLAIGICDSSIAIDSLTQNRLELQKNLPMYLNLDEGSIVEGSVKFGGIQSDYIVDTSSEPFKPLFQISKALQDPKYTFWQKIGVIQYLLTDKLSIRSKYDDPDYLNLVHRYRQSGFNIPLSEYVSCRVGVCRENAMIFHLILKEAGISNKLVFVRVEKLTNQKQEDHAFVIVHFEEQDWVIDSYESSFNGILLADLIRKTGNTQLTITSPLTAIDRTPLRVLYFLSYPKVKNR